MSQAASTSGIKAGLPTDWMLEEFSSKVHQALWKDAMSRAPFMQREKPAHRGQLMLPADQSRCCNTALMLSLASPNSISVLS